MKNLFRQLATSLANSVSIPYQALNKTQNNHSANVHSTFFTPGGDLLQTYEKETRDCLFGAVHIQLKTPYLYLTDAESVLHFFLEGLQQRFCIKHATDARYHFSKKEFEHFTTLYWQDTTGTDWKVRGWTNGQAMAVHYIKNINALPVWQEERFLNCIGRIAG